MQLEPRYNKPARKLASQPASPRAKPCPRQQKSLKPNRTLPFSQRLASRPASPPRRKSPAPVPNTPRFKWSSSHTMYCCVLLSVFRVVAAFVVAISTIVTCYNTGGKDGTTAVLLKKNHMHAAYIMLCYVFCYGLPKLTTPPPLPRPDPASFFPSFPLPLPSFPRGRK